jgi:hypothetical protein
MIAIVSNCYRKLWFAQNEPKMSNANKPPKTRYERAVRPHEIPISGQ